MTKLTKYEILVMRYNLSAMFILYNIFSFLFAGMENNSLRFNDFFYLVPYNVLMAIYYVPNTLMMIVLIYIDYSNKIVEWFIRWLDSKITRDIDYSPVYIDEEPSELKYYRLLLKDPELQYITDLDERQYVIDKTMQRETCLTAGEIEEALLEYRAMVAEEKRRQQQFYRQVDRKLVRWLRQEKKAQHRDIFDEGPIYLEKLFEIDLEVEMEGPLYLDKLFETLVECDGKDHPDSLYLEKLFL